MHRGNSPTSEVWGEKKGFGGRHNSQNWHEAKKGGKELRIGRTFADDVGEFCRQTFREKKHRQKKGSRFTGGEKTSLGDVKKNDINQWITKREGLGVFPLRKKRRECHS